MALAMQDRMLVFTENGHDWIRRRRSIGRSRRRSGPGESPATDAGRGALILRNGSHRRIITGVGNGVKQVTVVHSEKDGNPIGSARVPDHGGKVAWCVAGSNDAGDTSRGYIGRWRYELGADGTLTGPVDIGYRGGSGSATPRGWSSAVEKNSGETIWRSTDYGATWKTWATAPGALPADRQRARSSRSTASGRRACGRASAPAGRPTDRGRRIRDQQARSPAPDRRRLPGLRAAPRGARSRTTRRRLCLGNIYGGSSVFRTRNLGDATPTWEDISGNGPRQPRYLFVHPVTGELISSYHQGSMILPAPSGQRTARRISQSLYDRIGAYPGLK